MIITGKSILMTNSDFSKMSIVFTSCDAYSDILKYHMQLFNKYWHDCGYPKVLTTQTDTGTFPANAFKRVDAWGGDIPWSQRLLSTLKTLDAPYFLLILDDFFMSDNFTNAQVAHYLEIMEEHKACGLRLAPLPKPNLRISHEYGEYQKGKAYRVSAQIGIWDRKYMISLLEELGPCELWYYERYGSFLSEKFDQPSLGTYRKVFPYIEAICKSLWISKALRFLKKEGIVVDLSIRGKNPHGSYYIVMFVV